MIALPIEADATAGTRWTSSIETSEIPGCGVSDAPLLAVGRTTIDLIRAVARSLNEAERARKLHERTVAETAARMRDHLAECPTAIADFERAERN